MRIKLSLILITLMLGKLFYSQTVTPVCFNVLNGNNSPSVGLDPRSLVSADFNGDGKSDLAVANNNSNNVSILLSVGNGSFAGAVNFTVGAQPKTIIAGDFNIDGKADLAVANFGSSNLSILLGTGTGSFALAVNYAVTSNPLGITAADFDNDGKIDLAIANNGNTTVSVLLGSNTGTFAPATNCFIGASPNAITSADFNNDGNIDIACTFNSSNNAAVLFGTGTGSFSIAANYPVGTNPKSIITADFNGDSYKDLAVANNGSSNVSILLGSITGTFAAAANFSTSAMPASIISADFNNDGIADLATGNGSNNISTLLGTGSASFSPLTNYYTIACQAITAGDFNGDGNYDLATTNFANGCAVAFLGTGIGTFTGIFNYPVGINPQAVISSDFNNDSKPDLAVANYGSNNISILFGVGNGMFLPAINYTAGNNPSSITSADFNGDSNMDLAVSNFSSNTVSIFFGSSSGTFTLVSSYTVNTNPTCVIASDFNNDSKLDLAVCNQTSGDITILLGVGNGIFNLAGNYSVGLLTSPNSIAAADFNGDGKIDLAVAKLNYVISILLGTGTGSFGTPTNVTAGTNPTSLIICDFNNDSKMDLAVVNVSSPNISILLGLGTGGFAPAVNYATSALSVGIISADFNGDGKIDLATCNGSSHNISILLGSGLGTFSAATNYSVGTNPNPQSLISADFNGDGTADIATANFNNNNLTILLNGVAPVSVSSTNSVCSGYSATLIASGSPTYSWSTSSVSNSIVVTPSLTTSYTVTGSTYFGCKSTAVKTISVDAGPPIATNSGSICIGNSFTISPSGAVSYTLSSGINIVSPTVTSTYSITGTDINGCISATPLISTVTVNPLPVITVNSGSVCSGNSFTITPVGAVSYTFSGGSNIVTPTINSTYSITGTDNGGCASIFPAISTVAVNSLPVITVNSGSVCAGQAFILQPSGANTYTYSSASSIVTPTSTTSYSVTGSSIQGCISQAIAVSNVIVYPIPTLTANSGTICIGDSFTIIPTGAISYSYSGGSASVSPTVNTTYMITGINAFGCVDSVFNSILVNPLPSLSVISNNSILCVGQSAILSVSGAVTYTWSTASNSTSIIVSPVSSTNYTVYGVDANGCMNSSFITQSVSICTNFDSPAINTLFGIRVYPNPTSGILQIEFKEINENTKVEIYNTLGQLVFEEIISQNSSFNIQNLPNGMYTLNILTNNSQLFRSTIVKQ